MEILLRNMKKGREIERDTGACKIGFDVSASLCSFCTTNYRYNWVFPRPFSLFSLSNVDLMFQ